MTATLAPLSYRPAAPMVCPTDSISRAAVACLMDRKTSRELAEYAVANLPRESVCQLAQSYVDEQFAALGF